jgi:hypothetical protein
MRKGDQTRRGIRDKRNRVRGWGYRVIPYPQEFVEVAELGHTTFVGARGEAPELTGVQDGTQPHTLSVPMIWSHGSIWRVCRTAGWELCMKVVPDPGWNSIPSKRSVTLSSIPDATNAQHGHLVSSHGLPINHGVRQESAGQDVQGNRPIAVNGP